MTNAGSPTEYSSLIIPNKPAIVFNDEEYGKTLLIADLHIGYLYGKNKRGIIVPFSENPEEDLLKLVNEIECRRVIVLGDFKDEIFGGPNPIAGRIYRFVQELSKKTHLTIIKGNHDGNLDELIPESVELVQSSGLVVRDKENNKALGLWHGHATPALDVLNCDITITGHGHPAYSFRDEIGSKITEKVWVKAQWKKASEEQKIRLHIIMPAFNHFIEGYSVDDDYFESTILIKDAVDLNNAEVFNLEGVLIGTIIELKEARKEIFQKYLERRKELPKKRKGII